VHGAGDGGHASQLHRLQLLENAIDGQLWQVEHRRLTASGGDGHLLNVLHRGRGPLPSRDSMSCWHREARNNLMSRAHGLDSKSRKTTAKAVSRASISTRRCLCRRTRCSVRIWINNGRRCKEQWSCCCYEQDHIKSSLSFSA
jgi:hypothetical protein